MWPLLLVVGKLFGLLVLTLGNMGKRRSHNWLAAIYFNFFKLSILIVWWQVCESSKGM